MSNSDAFRIENLISSGDPAGSRVNGICSRLVQNNLRLFTPISLLDTETTPDEFNEIWHMRCQVLIRPEDENIMARHVILSGMYTINGFGLEAYIAQSTRVPIQHHMASYIYSLQTPYLASIVRRFERQHLLKGKSLTLLDMDSHSLEMALCNLPMDPDLFASIRDNAISPIAHVDKPPIISLPDHRPLVPMRYFLTWEKIMLGCATRFLHMFVCSWFVLLIYTGEWKRMVL
jgi:hypothetical protein